jgi:hypothetical protein
MNTNPPPPQVVQVYCSSIDEIDAIWRALWHVPDDAFVPCDVFLDGVFRYRVIRTDGEQTAAQPAAQPGCSSPVP